MASRLSKGTLVLFMCSGALSRSAAADIPAPHMSVFGNWFVACDNVRRCEARGVSEDAQGADLRLIRNAGPAGATLILNAGRPVPGAVRVGNQPFTFGPAWRRSADGGVSTLTTSNAGEIARLIALARTAQVLTSGTGTTVPLDGMVAALLRIDDVQQRAGTGTAFAGPRGTNAVPRAPKLPAAVKWKAPVPLNNAAALATLSRNATALLLKSNECTVEPEDNAYALDNLKAIVLLACRRYAYQDSAIALVVPRDGGSAVPFAPVLPTKHQPMSVLILADFDPKTGRLSTAAKGRGFADCGMRASWVWSNSAFSLVSMEEQPLCGGTAPGDWATMYRTR